MRARGWAAGWWLLLALPAQAPSAAWLAANALDAKVDVEQRCRSLAALQDLGALDVATVVAALADAEPALGMTAAAIVRHEWRELPDELFAALDREPLAVPVLLRELALAPRPAAAAWARRWSERDGIGRDLRCLALAASGRELGAAAGDLLLAALVDGDVDDGFHAAVGLLPPAVADGLLGKLHALLLSQQVDVGRLAPFFDRLSAKGLERLLGLVVTLPPDVGEALCLHLVQHEVAAYTARATAALDGQIPLEPLWLLRAGPLLGEPARRERLLAVLGDGAASPTLRRRACEALIDGGVVEARLLDFVQDAGSERGSLLRALLDESVQGLPAARLVAWLDAEPEVAQLVAAALLRRPTLGDAVEARLVEVVTGGEVVEGVFPEACVQALLLRGSEPAVDRIWPALRGAVHFVEFVESLARRQAPFVHELLLEELAAPPAAGVDDGQRAHQLDAVRLALCAQGDRRQLAALVARAKDADPAFVRRCRHFAPSLDESAGLALLDDAAQLADDDHAAELIAWAAMADGAEVTARLVRLWQAPELGERQEAALRGIVAGPNRARLQADLRAALAKGPLDERSEQLAFELVAALPAPLAAGDAELLAALAVEAPLVDRVGEAERAQRWPDGRYGFPLVGAVAQRLRGAEVAAVAPAFRAASARAMALPGGAGVSRQRLLVLWRSLEADRAMLAVVGAATAALLLAIPHAEGLGDGPAHWFLAPVASAEGDHPAAAAHAARAVAGLLRLPVDRRTARLFLGERDPAAGDDPWAALAAQPFLAAARAALAKGEPGPATAALALAAEFAGRDAATRATIDTLTKEIPR